MQRNYTLYNSLPDLQWQKLHQCNEKPCTPCTQSAEVGAEPSFIRILLGNVPDVQDGDKPSDLTETELYIDSGRQK